MIPSDLDPEIVSVGTSRALRIKRIGRVYFVENLQHRRHVAQDGGPDKIEEEWKVIAVSKPGLAREGKTPRQEAHEFLMQANQQVLEMMRQDLERARSAQTPGSEQGK